MTSPDLRRGKRPREWAGGAWCKFPPRPEARLAATIGARAVRLLLVMLALSCAAYSCGGADSEPQVGSETNFLKYCGEGCGEGLVCLCGVCTRACTGSIDCAGLVGEATCVSVPEDPSALTTGSCQRGAVCELSCVNDGGCRTLGEGYRCEAGYCRQGERACASSSLPAGDYERSIVVDGTTRHYLMHVPSQLSNRAQVPLVLDFHPMGFAADMERTTSGFLQLSDEVGFIAVWPQGLDNTWNVGPCCALTNVGDDYAFARALVRHLMSEACIDPSRVYAVGHSMGGAMAYYLGCQQAELFAAVAVSSMDLFTESEIDCVPSRAVSEIAFRGTADTVVPYEGGACSPPGYPDMVHTVLGAEGNFERWAELNGCSGQPTAADANGCSRYTTCRDDTEVVLCSVAAGGQVLMDPRLSWDLLSQHSTP